MRDQLSDSAADGGKERLARAARAARELSETIWDCLQEELAEPDRGQARALSERLAEVSRTLTVLLDARAPRERDGEAPGSTADDPALGGDIGVGLRPAAAAGEGIGAGSRSPAAADGGVDAGSRPGATGAGEGVDARPQPGAPPVERRTPPEPVASTPEPPGARVVDERGPTATVMPFFGRSTAQPPSSACEQDADIAIRDVRREEGPSAWISSVGQMLARHSQDRLPFAVLLVEIVDVAHLERSETPHDLHGLVAQVESALGRGMRATDELSRETLGRYWLLAPETDGAGARTLAERLALLVRSSATHRGAPMEVAIGIAVCPDDGIEAPALAARADLGVYSARAAGRSIAHTEPPVR